MNISYLIVAFLVLGCFTSCENDDEEEAKVLTEEVLYVSGNTARLVGRILVVPNGTISSYGFLISQSEDFMNSITIDVQGDGDLGRFIGETTNLESGRLYYCTAFMVVDGNQVVGNTIPFNSLLPKIRSFSPSISKAGSQLTIQGANFTDNVRVFVGENEATVTDVNFESEIVVTIPEPTSELNVTIRVIDGENELETNQIFEYVSGKWSLETTFFNNNHFRETLNYNSSGSLYYGFGVDEAGQLNPNIWRMDLDSYSWSGLPFQSFHRTPFSANGYFGSGAITFFPKNFSNDFYYFDGVNFDTLAPTPFRLIESIAFELQNEVLVLGGSNTSTENYTMYSYNKLDDNWVTLEDVPFIIDAELPHFINGNTIYVFNRADGALWNYEIGIDRWAKFIDLPMNLGAGGIAAVLGNRVFVGMFRFSNDIWELDLNTLEWKEKIAYPNSKGDTNAGFYTYDNKVFILKNPFTGSTQNEKLPMQIWSFDPDIQ